MKRFMLWWLEPLSSVPPRNKVEFIESVKYNLNITCRRIIVMVGMAFTMMTAFLFITLMWLLCTGWFWR